MRVVILTLFVALAHSATAQRPNEKLSSRWLILLPGPEWALSVDSQTIAPRDSGWLKAWIRSSYAKNQKSSSGKPYRTMLSLEVVDCRRKRWKTLEAVTYSADGTVVEHGGPVDEAVAHWTEPTPDTYGEAELQLFCVNEPRFRR